MNKIISRAEANVITKHASREGLYVSLQHRDGTEGAVTTPLVCPVGLPGYRDLALKRREDDTEAGYNAFLVSAQTELGAIFLDMVLCTRELS